MKLTEQEKELILAYAKNDMNAKETEREHFMAIGGFRYHAKKIKEKTGLSPFRFYDLVELLKEAKGEVCDD